MDYSRRVHVAPVRHERDRVVEPLREYAADAVHLLFHEGDRTDPPAYHDEVVATLEGDLGVDVATWTVDHFDVYDVFGLVTTLADAHAEDDVSVNVSTGSKLAAVGASLGCMDTATDATAYYVQPAERAHDGRESPATRGVASVGDLPTYPIDSPTRDQVVVLLLAAVENAGLSRADKRTLIDRSMAFGATLDGFAFGEALLADYAGVAPEAADGVGFDDLSTSAKKGAYRRLDRELGSLEERGYVEIVEEGRRRNVPVGPRGGAVAVGGRGAAGRVPRGGVRVHAHAVAPAVTS